MWWWCLLEVMTFDRGSMCHGRSCAGVPAKRSPALEGLQLGPSAHSLGAPRQIPLAFTIHQQKIRSKHQPMSKHYKLSSCGFLLPASRPKQLVDLSSSQGPQTLIGLSSPHQWYIWLTRTKGQCSSKGFNWGRGVQRHYAGHVTSLTHLSD